MNKYVPLEMIGEGAYGVVMKGRNLITNELVAIKRVSLDDDDNGIPATSIREVSLLKELHHPNIVVLKDVVLEHTTLSLIFDFYPTDLRTYLNFIRPGEHLSPMWVKSFTFQLTQAMLYCHRRRILHRDLKPQNLLVSESGLIKVADFGLGRTFGVPVRMFNHAVVALWYRAPEILLGSTRYSCPVDIWSIGCILAEMCTLKAIFQGDSEIDQLFKIFHILSTPTEETWPGISKLPEFRITFPCWTINILGTVVKNLNDKGMDLLKKYLTFDPLKRICAKAAICHDYFSDLDLSKLPIYYD